MKRGSTWLVLAAAVFLLWTGWLIRDLLLSILVAAFLVALFSPLQRSLQRRWGPRRKLIASFLTAAALLLLVLPSAFVMYLIVDEVAQGLAALKADLGREGLVRLSEGRLPPRALEMVHHLQKLVPVPTDRLERNLGELIQRVPRALGGLAGVSARSFIHLLFLGFGTFYFFLDGELLLAFLADISPFQPRHTQAFFREFQDVAWAMIYGSAVTVFTGALVSVLGFWALKVPNPLFWGTLTGLFTLAPGIGCALIFVPLSLGLLVLGHPLQAVGVTVYSEIMLVIVNDTLFRPLIVGQRLRLHPFLILLSIFGGLEAYGIAGLLVGPMAAAFAVTGLRLYRDDRPRARGWLIQPAPPLPTVASEPEAPSQLGSPVG